MTPLEALAAARETESVFSEKRARVTAARRLCRSLAHRGSDSVCFACARCVRAVDDCAGSLFGTTQ